MKCRHIVIFNSIAPQREIFKVVSAENFKDQLFMFNMITGMRNKGYAWSKAILVYDYEHVLIHGWG